MKLKYILFDGSLVRDSKDVIGKIFNFLVSSFLIFEKYR